MDGQTACQRGQVVSVPVCKRRAFWWSAELCVRGERSGGQLNCVSEESVLAVS
jgi:hypothetical protein